MHGPRVSILGRTEKKAERLARRILDDVLAQGLSTGAPLPNEATMLGHYGVGRITLREALRILEVHGLLTIRPGPSGGPVVAHADSRDFGRMSSLFFRAAGVRLVDLMEARNLMEVTAARLAAQQRDADGIERLRTVLKALESLQGEESNAEFLAISRDFHDVVNSMSGNPAIDLVSSSFVHMVLDRMTGFAYPAARRFELTSQHIAIAHGDPAGQRFGRRAAHARSHAGYADDARLGWNTDAKFETVSWS